MKKRAVRWLSRRIPSLVMAVGVVLVGGILVESIAIAPRPFSRVFLGGVATSLPVSLFLVAGGYWLARSPIPVERYRRIAGWSLAGFAFFTSFTLLIGLSISEAFWARIAVPRWGIAIGTGSGFLIGVFEARAIEQAVAAERIRAQELERRRKLLDYLNGILRHEVLNTANIIMAHASFLRDAYEEESEVQEYAGSIYGQAEGLTSITNDVQRLLQATDESTGLEPVDLSTVLREELQNLQDRYTDVDVETSIPSGITVKADELLPRLFSNLFENAVEHNDNTIPRVSVTATAADETVTIRIEDNGPGIRKEEREDLFEWTTRADTTHGLGLSIVAMLARRYDGRVELTETSPEGSVFTVELLMADAGPRTA